MILNSPYISGSLTVTGNATIQGQLTVTGSLSGTASLASNSLLLEGTGSTGFATTSSLLAVSSSQQQISASLLSLTASYNALSSSYTSLSASYNVASSSFSTRITSDSSSLSSRTTQIENVYATTGSNSFTGVQNFSNTCTPNSFTAGASLYTAGGLRVTQDAYFSSSVYIKGNVTVYGTQSVAYISSSQLDIGTNIITVNTATPSIRYGGLSVFDSGSTGLTGSIFWDSELNRWIYSNASGSGGGATYGGGMFISGPRNSQGIGCEQGTTACMLLVGQGGDHLTSSMIYHDSAVTCIPNCLVIGGALSGTTIYGSTAVCSPVGKFTTCIDAGSGMFSSSVTATSLYATVGSVSITQDGTYGSNYGMIGFGGTTNGSNRIFAGVGTYDGLYLASATGKNIEFRPAGTFAMTILSTGSVGIGTNNPSQLLHLETTLASSSGVGTSIQITSGGAGGDQAWIGVNKGTGNGLEFSVENRDIIFNTGTTTPFGGTERMRITCTGNVGIGTCSPSYLLDVNGTGRFGGSITSLINTAGVQNQLILENLSAAAGADGNIIYFKGYQGSLAKISAYGYPQDQVGGYLQLQSYSDNTTANIGLIINQNGNVGIGTTNPSQKLTVTGIINSEENGDYYGVWIQGSCTAGKCSTIGLGPWYSQAGYIQWIDNDRLRIYTCSSGRNLTLQETGGNVGIGTTAPGGVLDAGCSVFDATTIFRRKSQTGDAGWTALRLVSEKTTAAGDGFGTAISFLITDSVNTNCSLADLVVERDGSNFCGAYSFRTYAGSGTGVERMRITSGGKVLVGTASNANTGLGTYTKQSIVGDGSINAAASHGSMFVAAGTGTADTGISVNQSTSGMTMMLLASINTSTGTSTNSAVYIVRFYFDGNNTPTATYIGGSSDFVTFGKSGSNTLTLTGSSAGNKSYAWFVNKFGDT